MEGVRQDRWRVVGRHARRRRRRLGCLAACSPAWCCPSRRLTRAAPSSAEYGDKDNSDLSEKYSIKSDDFPQYRFWGKGKGASAAPLAFAGEQKKEDFLRFIQEKAGAWIGLPGQVKEMDALAKEFVEAKKKEGVLKKAEKAAGKLDAKEGDEGKYYVKVMTKALADAEFVAKETARLKKMIDDGSVKDAKKQQFGRRLNALSSFS